MLSSYNVDICELAEEVGYRLEVVASHLGKMDRDKEKYQYDDSLTQSTMNQVNFLDGKRLPEKDIPVSEYFDAVNLYHNVLKNLLEDIESDKKALKCAAIDKYQHIIQSLDSLIGAIEHESVSDVPYLLKDMYDVVKGRSKEN
ncbi:MAG: hypothetical protein GQ477_03140 [Nanohaloarchaea archaeon]|nr:hypothetical protein [Candidatus Nanohaloarchaea archaeon]